MAASFAIPVLLGATIGFLALRNAPESLTLSVLALIVGKSPTSRQPDAWIVRAGPGRLVQLVTDFEVVISWGAGSPRLDVGVCSVGGGSATGSTGRYFNG